MEQDVLISKHIIRFSITFTIILITVSIIFSLLGIEANSSLTIIAQMSACSYVISIFIKNHKRLPTKTEKTILFWYTFLASWGVSIVLFLLLLLIDPTILEVLKSIQSIGLVWILGIVVFVSLLQLGVIYFSYNFLARKQFEAMQKKGVI